MKNLFILFSILFSSILTADSNSEKEAALSWLKIVDSGQYSESWKKAAPDFQKQISSLKWEGALNQVRTPLGKVISRQVKNTSKHSVLPGTSKGEYIVIILATDFAQKKSVTETITVSKVGSEWLTVGYFIK